ncbi:methylmalonyl-CoA carboxyltransferase [SAR202 cluster bacterium AC-409-J13_OGT_754m]|nr:methylmalonyl-CoA carboxyltransferase [SAR202 cluster bacterium AC-409-J13_OGT_754m]
MAIEPESNRRVERLQTLREQSQLGGGQEKIDRQHSKGKLTARERLSLLFDDNTFTELDPFVTPRTNDFPLKDNRPSGDAVVTGYGRIRNRLTFAYAQDFTIMGGSVSEAVGSKICKVMDLALKTGAPIVGLNDSGGARIQEGVLSLAAYGDIFLRNTLSSGVIPQISIILGPSAGGAVYSPAITDFVFMVQGIGQMYITGPEVIKAVLGEEVTHEDLGGAATHAFKSGVAHFISETEEECFEHVRRLLSFLPQNNMEDSPFIGNVPDRADTDPNLSSIVPEEPNHSYDIRDVMVRVVDDNDLMEVHANYAPNIVVALSRIGGSTVGLVGNQPDHLAGVLDINASVKAARFVRFCDAFNIPIVTFVDVPGFLPGTDQEYGGIIRHGAKLLYAYAEATVPKVSLMIRKAYGGAYIVMGSKHLRGDINLAWPSAEIAVMGPEAAVNIIFRDKISKSVEPSKTKEELTQEYRDNFANPYVAASHGFLDEVIDPSETRSHLIRALEMLQNKRDSLPPKKHGNIPL